MNELKKFIGLILLLIVIVAALSWRWINGDALTESLMNSTTTVTGLIGSEKSAFLENPNVRRILARKYGLNVAYRKAGSIELVRGETSKEDFLWPSSEVAVEIYKGLNKPMRQQAVIFNSPIVLYSWEVVVSALLKTGIVEKTADTFFVADMPKLIELIKQRKRWSEIGLEALYGSVSVISTDPLKSNSGNQYAGLVATILNGGEVPSRAGIDAQLPELQAIFARLGYLEHSSGVLFDQFLRTGVGNFPIIVGYENSLVEFALQNADVWGKVKDKIRLVYPVPTVWSAHTIISITEPGNKLLNALQDRDIQRLAWEQHGFRSGLAGVQNDPKVLGIVGIPEQIEKVVPMPSAAVMDQIVLSLDAEQRLGIAR